MEHWTVENHALEDHALETHAFRIHQINFLLMEVNSKPVPHKLLDTITVPFWDGQSAYHTVKVRMDFRDPEIAGTFVYHCHILDHEDLGMMAKIQVNAAQ